MATKAERFRYELEREKPRKTKNVGGRNAAAKGPRRQRVAKQKAGSRARGAIPHTSRSSRAAFALETSRGRPSRKSTRKSANRIKANSNLTRREIRRVRSPKTRAATMSK
jgi:hypothetical protein